MLKLSFALPPFFILSLLLMLSLGGCEGSDAVPEMETAPIVDEDKIPLWLDGQVEMSPQEWLVKRSRAEVTDERAEIERTAELLVIAADRFDESHRMIANRAAQLEDMLLEHRINETAVDRLEWFTKLPTLQTPHSFSALCQYYYNLRTQGKTEDEIIQNLLRI
ncbi:MULTISPECIES: hypothetical protein [unclassified Methylophaga]|jgi:hypothetical protein|uniref:hypothetical protein n=2 Tax=Methylophaga TaxID=40222 RepID=UPI0025EF09C8|nr:MULTISPECIES: hypothetical protein [unclassified Methylophaga]|tara:strand:- start:58443 stop:58934 length:492 start_codon:yes stop_codon:yes gene_type:complete